jgi:hypothetical protein
VAVGFDVGDDPGLCELDGLAVGAPVADGVADPP